jgi:hypothetical protein
MLVDNPAMLFRKAHKNAVLIAVASLMTLVAEYPANSQPPPQQPTITGPLTVTFQTQVDPKKSVEPKEPQKHAADSKYTDPIAVQVLDEEGRPLPGAKVTFTLPPGNGPTAILKNGKQEVQVTANDQGISKICDVEENCPMKANKIGGPFKIKASAEFYGETGSNTLDTVNKPLPVYKKRSVRILGSATAVALILIFTLRSNSPNAVISVVSPSGPVTGH